MIRTGMLLIAILLISTANSAAQITIGVPAPAHVNCFPFTCAGAEVNTRYQQVYAASNFDSPVAINGITFFRTVEQPGDFATADYAITLSTSNFTVNNLDVTNLDANPGPDAQFFTTVSLAGAVDSSFTISGAPFHYDPANGDLLVDIVRSNYVLGSGSTYLDSMNGTANGLFSRAHNFGTEYDNWGLVTRFELVPEPSTAFLMIGSAVLMTFRAVGGRTQRSKR